MDLFTLIPRTIVGVTYPAFASLKAVLSDSPESCGAWLRSVHQAIILKPKVQVRVTLAEPKNKNCRTHDNDKSGDVSNMQVLGGAGRVQSGGAAAGPGHQPPGLLLPRLPHPQVRLPRLVHGPCGVEWQRRHLQQCQCLMRHI